MIRTSFASFCRSTVKINLIILIALMLTSCATIAPPAPAMEMPWKSREAKLTRIQHWQINGKIAVQSSQEAGSATVNWIQQQNHFTISLLGPLGSSGLQMQGQPGGVTLKTAQGKTFHATNPEQLLAEQWGFHVPVSYLNYWIRGLPVPSVEANTQWDTYGRISTLTQEGWKVQFLSYTRADGFDLPSKINITSSSLKVKIIVYHWQV